MVCERKQENGFAIDYSGCFKDKRLAKRGVK